MKLKTIKDILERLDEKFKPETIQLMLSSKKVYKIDEKLLRQFIATEIKELLAGFKDKLDDIDIDIKMGRDEDIAYLDLAVEKLKELREDINKILK